MDLANRTEREQALQAAVAAVFTRYRDELASGGTLFLGNFEEELTNALKAELATTFGEAGTQLLDSFGENGFAIGQWAQQQATELAANLTTSIADQVASGTTAPEKVFPDSRAESIAITETTRAATQGMDLAAMIIAAGGSVALAAARSSALAPDRTWHTAEDDRVCEICGPIDGTAEEVWSQVAPSGPPAHPRCRCYLTFEGLEA